MKIIEITSIVGYETALSSLLSECVNDGASIGFLAPLSAHESDQYWQDVEQDLKSRNRKLFLAVANETVVGTVQLGLTKKKNGQHRGEVEKLMVSVSARGNGYGAALMGQLETAARNLGLSLLVLDTREGDVASLLYSKLGFVKVGVIPEFALSSVGTLDGTVMFYKKI